MPIMNSSAPVMPKVFAKNAAAKRTAAAKVIAARKKRECTGLGIYIADRIARANEREKDELYADQDDDCEE